MVLKIALDIDAGAGFAFEQDQRQRRDLLHRVDLIEFQIIRRGDEDRMRVDAVPHAVDRLVRRFAGERNIHLPGMKVIEHHGRRAIQDADADVWIVLVERLEPGEQIGLRDRVARADDQLAGQQLARGGDLFLAALEQAERVAHVFEQQLALARQADAARAAREEPDLQLLFELLDRLAHRRL